MSEPEYLAAEERAAMRSEYIAGEVFAMAGMKLRVPAERAFYYPDAMLVCDDADDHPQYKERPCFIAEVLSPGTANIDAREKWLHYRELPTLRYYLMVDSERVWARLLSRAEDGRWLEQQLDAGEVVRIECGGLAIGLSLEDLYEDTGLSIG